MDNTTHLITNNYPVPLILKCNISGKVVKYYSKPYIEKRIAQAGDLATLLNTFMAKGAKKKQYPATKTWKGKDIITTPEVQVSSECTNKGTKIFTFKEGPNCTVTYPDA